MYNFESFCITVQKLFNFKYLLYYNVIKSVLKFLFNNIGNPLSSKKISDTMTSLGRKINSRTVKKYLEVFSESYIVYPAKRYNIKGK